MRITTPPATHHNTSARVPTRQLKRSTSSSHDKFSELLKSLDDSVSDCILYGESGHYKIFLEIILSFMQEFKEFFTIQNLQQFSDSTPKTNELVASFIDFLVVTIGELLNFGTDSSVLVSDQVKFLLKELESLLTFLGDNPTQCAEPEQNNIVTEIEVKASEAGFFLHCFFFTTDLVTATKMDLALSVLLQRIEIVEVKIKDHCVAVSKLPKTDVLSLIIVDSLLDDFSDLMNNKDDLSVTEKDQIRTLHKELMFSRSFLADIDVLQNLEIKECAIQLRDLAYEAEYIINLILVEDSLAWHLTLYDFIQKNKLIWTELREIKVKCGIGGLQVAENPTEVSSQDKSVPMADEITVGFKDVTTQIASQLVGGQNSRQIISIVGMGGLGKTTIAKKLFNDSIVRSHFDKLAWCVVSQTYKKKKMLMDILSSVSNLKRDKILEMEDGEMAEHLYKSLKGLRYLIIMDDMENEDPMEDLDKLFPDDTQGSRILFTSRLKKVASVTSQVIIKPPPMSQGECWNLLEQRVFKKERCPQELQDIGKQIASNCQGLPLLVVVIASVVSNMEKNKSLWLQVLQD
ncbi:NB-ARC domain-containing protein [Abeliophyllum distichum]|uniref:NB-ARC domain-containing protein n=1 Tax=Abeliophyllum distichum TaxID=126358 RepID=A0ABD1V1V1_9LAMI